MKFEHFFSQIFCSKLKSHHMLQVWECKQMWQVLYLTFHPGNSSVINYIKSIKRLWKLWSLACIKWVSYGLAGLGGEPVTNGHRQIAITSKIRIVYKVYAKLTKHISDISAVYYYVLVMHDSIYSSRPPDILGLYLLTTHFLTHRFCSQQNSWFLLLIFWC